LNNKLRDWEQQFKENQEKRKDKNEYFISKRDNCRMHGVIVEKKKCRSLTAKKNMLNSNT